MGALRLEGLLQFRKSLVKGGKLSGKRIPLLFQRGLLRRLRKRRLRVGPALAQRIHARLKLGAERLVRGVACAQCLQQPLAHARALAQLVGKLLRTRVVRRERSLARDGRNLGLQLLVFAFQLAGGLAELLLQILEALRAEQLAKDGLARGRVGREQGAEFTLREHDDLLELPRVNAEQLLDVRVDGACAGDAAAVGQRELGVGRLVREAVPALLRPFVVRVALDHEGFAAIRKRQLNIGARVRCGEIAAQGRCGPGAVFAVAARLAEQREGNGVEDHGLARAGVAADQVYARNSQLREIDDGLPRVGAEGGKRQGERPHRASPPSCWWDSGGADGASPSSASAVPRPASEPSSAVAAPVCPYANSCSSFSCSSLRAPPVCSS